MMVCSGRTLMEKQSGYYLWYIIINRIIYYYVTTNKVKNLKRAEPIHGELCLKFLGKRRFLIQDGLYRNPCVSVCMCICIFFIFRIVNETSIEDSLALLVIAGFGALLAYSVQRLN